jgi:phosphate transport system permease protein
MRRKFFSNFMVVTLCGVSVIAILPLVSIFIDLVRKGFSSLDWAFFTQLPRAVGEEGGGLANALLGSLILLILAVLTSVFWGIMAGLYLSEYSRGRTTRVLRMTIDLLTSVPSIVVGIFTYAVLVVPMGGFSAYAGGIALGIIMIPIIARTTEEILKLVPMHYREAGLALGIPRWKVIVYLVLRGARGGVLTGVILAVARAAGETAPLLFTAFNNQFWSRGLNQPTASLPVQIYTYAISPYEEWHRKAWAGALILIIFVFVVNWLARKALPSA